MTDTSTDTLTLLHNEYWLRPAAEIDAELASLRATSPIAFVEEPEVPPEIPLEQGPGAWVLTRHADILEVSKNPEIYSSAQGITLLDQPPEFNEFFGSMIAMDDPRHARLRRIVSKGFTPRTLARLEESVQEIAAQIVDDVCERGEVDFVVDVAAALPLKIVCELMGIPDSQYEFVFDQTNVILGAGDPEYVANTEDVLTAILTAGANLAGVMSEVAEAKRGGDGTDLTSVLVNAEIEDDKLSDSDIASFFVLLVVAGNETTRNAISWGLKYLTDNPDQRALWAADFDGGTNGAVEEIVRLASPVTYMRRTATQDTVLDGQAIAEGDKVAMFYYAGNRDPELFENPLAFDVGRQTNAQAGFGGPGPHFCLGAHLARREITVMFRELFDRLPDIAATGEPALLSSAFIHGIKHMDATFTPTAPRS
ncbi:MAG: cytochrome P450 [Actinomycetota bacterium]